MTQTLYIFGTSGLAREARDVAVETGWSVIFVAKSREDVNRWRGEEPVIHEADIPQGVNCAIGIGDNRIRRKVALRHSSQVFPSLIHPSASFGYRQAERLQGKQGLIICAGARFMSQIEIGDFVVADLNCTIGHDVIIGDYVLIAPGANVAGYVEMREGVWLGSGSVINQGSETRRLRIGAYTTIGSGAVVVNDCEPDSVYVGVPARKR